MKSLKKSSEFVNIAISSRELKIIGNVLEATRFFIPAGEFSSRIGGYSLNTFAELINLVRDENRQHLESLNRNKTNLQASDSEIEIDLSDDYLSMISSSISSVCSSFRIPSFEEVIETDKDELREIL
ncbi:MAG: hypothetical protein AAFP03_08285 [Cyanobacteria bacterium J06598_3]